MASGGEAQFINRMIQQGLITDLNGQPIGSGFGPDVAVQLANGSGTLKTIWEQILAYTDNTNLSEDSSMAIKLLRAGAQADVLTAYGDNIAGQPALWVRSANTNYLVPVLRVESSGANGAVMGFYQGGTWLGGARGDNSGGMNWVALGGHHFYYGGDFGAGALALDLTVTTGMLPQGRVQPKNASSTAVATSVTLNTDGGTFPLTVGTGTLNALATASWVAGGWGILTVPSGVTITHNVAGAGGTAPILTPTAASIVTTSKRAFLFEYDGTNFVIVG